MTNGLIKSGDVQGKHLVGHKGAKLGAVREMFVDLASGRIEFLIVETAGLLGGSGKFHPVPWAAVHYDAADDAFQIEMAKEAFKAAPGYDREQLGDASYGWNEHAARYFATAREGGLVA